MNTKVIRLVVRVAAWTAAAALDQFSLPVLSSPLGPAKAAASPTSSPAPTKAAASSSKSAAATHGVSALGVPQGQGAVVHSTNSPFAPLPKRDDVVPWSVLTAVGSKTEKNKILPVFGQSQLALHQTTQKVQGFMMPLEPGANQRHFLLTSVPLTCSFCLPGGPESMIEVRTKTPVKYSLEPVVVEGRMLVLQDDPYGLYYRIMDAVAVK